MNFLFRNCFRNFSYLFSKKKRLAHIRRTKLLISTNYSAKIKKRRIFFFFFFYCELLLLFTQIVNNLQLMNSETYRVC